MTNYYFFNQKHSELSKHWEGGAWCSCCIQRRTTPAQLTHLQIFLRGFLGGTTSRECTFKHNRKQKQEEPSWSETRQHQPEQVQVTAMRMMLWTCDHYVYNRNLKQAMYLINQHQGCYTDPGAQEVLSLLSKHFKHLVKEPHLINESGCTQK